MCQPDHLIVPAVGAVAAVLAFWFRESIAERAYGSRIVGEGCMATGFAVAEVIIGMGATLFLVTAGASCISP